MKKVRALGILFASILAMMTTTACQNGQTGNALSTTGSTGPAADMTALIAAKSFAAKPSASAIYLTIVKDSNIPVKASVNVKGGRIDLTDPAKPVGDVTLDLNSFDSGLPLRNDRVKEYFFRTEKNGDTATFKLTMIPADAIATLRAQKHADSVVISGDFTLNGVTVPLSVAVNLTFTELGTLSVKSVTPAKVSISKLGLNENLTALTTICQHKSVDDDVNVDFDFAFTP
jgi:polyisoprenoid-binding protein YceI